MVLAGPPIIIIILLFREFFPPALAKSFSLEFEWQ